MFLRVSLQKHHPAKRATKGSAGTPWDGSRGWPVEGALRLYEKDAPSGRILETSSPFEEGRWTLE